LRGPAKDVLLSDATSVVEHGWGFGPHTAMDQQERCSSALDRRHRGKKEHFGPAFLWLALPALFASLR